MESSNAIAFAMAMTDAPNVIQQTDDHVAGLLGGIKLSDKEI